MASVVMRGNKEQPPQSRPSAMMQKWPMIAHMF
jgi:hypothetical protein